MPLTGRHYFFFDGSSLITDVRALQESRGEFKGRKLLPLALVDHYIRTGQLNRLLGSEYKRAVFYFAKDDPQLHERIELPDSTQPEQIRDVSIKFCGERLRRPSGFDAWFAQQPPEFQQFCYKREKGVDIEICCDALQLAATGQLDRLVLYTNDSDFIPLCEKLKEFGSNISLIRLSSDRPVNRELVAACDSYQIVREESLNDVFSPKLP